MTSSIHNNREDLTSRVRSVGQGLNALRMCSRCCLPKSTAGGKTNKRTRMWRCAGCKEAV